MSSELGINRNTINKYKIFSNDFGPMKTSTTTRSHQKKKTLQQIILVLMFFLSKLKPEHSQAFHRWWSLQLNVQPDLWLTFIGGKKGLKQRNSIQGRLKITDTYRRLEKAITKTTRMLNRISQDSTNEIFVTWMQ